MKSKLYCSSNVNKLLFNFFPIFPTVLTPKCFTEFVLIVRSEKDLSPINNRNNFISVALPAMIIFRLPYVLAEEIFRFGQEKNELEVVSISLSDVGPP